MIEFTNVSSTVDDDIFVEQPWSFKDNLTHIHGHHIAQDLILTKIKVNQDKRLLIYF